ncbi:hypothetical protein ACFUMH_04635 [Cellulomonas sp. NPDC057328]|uniref:hypothetical protein n=1 Tax=Cellulomonas sp. NPDC057328 TaxID=3346101 RepID=UPI003626B172
MDGDAVTTVLGGRGVLDARAGEARGRPPWRDVRLHRVRRGAYAPAEEWAAWSPDDRARAGVDAVAAAAQRPPLFSHRSAAAVHGLPVVGWPDDRVHVTTGRSPGGRSHGDVTRHTTAAPPASLVVRGVHVTSVARTVVDLARHGGVLPAVVAGDHAVRTGATSVHEVEEELASLPPGTRGVRRARAALGLLDARAESPGESLSRVRMAESGLVAPVLQHVVVDARGVVARVDFWWPRCRVVGEFDGRVKYRSDVVPGTRGGVDPADVVWREKLREDRIRATGATVVRWTWDEAWSGRAMTDRLRAAGVPG